MLKVKIIIDDDGKKAELELLESDNLSKLIIIQNVFNLFGISTDVLEMTSTFNHIGRAYSSFFNEVKPIESSIEDLESKNEQIKKKMIEGLTNNKSELENTYKNNDDQPDFIATGIKTREDGTKLYRCRYHCVACWHRGTHYIYVESTHTWCHSCQHRMLVYPAHPDGFPNQDSFGNFFRAGNYKDRSLE